METKLKSTKVVAGLLVMAVITAFSLLGRAGSLEPSAAPAPTMKTLDQVEPRIPIPAGSVTSSYTISSSGSYYLTGDRTSTTTGISVNASNVTIDLMGYTLSESGIAGVNGINISANRKNIEIRNGTITLFKYDGIYAPTTCMDIRIIDVRCILNGGKGMELLGTDNRIENCLVAENEETGIHGGKLAVITNCIARDGNDNGIYVYEGSVVTGCSSYSNNGIGIGTNGGGIAVLNNNCYGNTSNGIYAYNGDVTIIGNTIKNNGGRGIQIYNGGGVVKDNFVSGSGTDGIYLASGITVVNNTAKNNANYGFYIGNGCAVIGNSSFSNGGYGFYIVSNCLVDQNVAYGNTPNMNALVGCTVPSGNHAP